MRTLLTVLVIGLVTALLVSWAVGMRRRDRDDEAFALASDSDAS
jgi:hypothetical protein